MYHAPLPIPANAPENLKWLSKPPDDGWFIQTKYQFNPARTPGVPQASAVTCHPMQYDSWLLTESDVYSLASD